MIEKVQEGHCVLHMWKIVISSQMSGEDQGTVKFSPDVEYTQDDDEAHSFTHRKGIVDIWHISLGHFFFFGNCFPSVILVKDGYWVVRYFYHTNGRYRVEIWYFW